MLIFTNRKLGMQFTESENKMDFDDDARLQKDARDVKRSVRIEHGLRSTTIVVVAISYDDMKNKTLFIPCESGDPISREAYDAVRDGFVVYGCAQFELGTVPVSYKINCNGLDCPVPLPMAVIRRYLTEKQKSAFAAWKSGLKDGHFFDTVQFLGVYE